MSLEARTSILEDRIGILEAYISHGIGSLEPNNGRDFIISKSLYGEIFMASSADCPDLDTAKYQLAARIYFYEKGMK